MTEPSREPEIRALRDAYRELQGPGSEACPARETLAALAVGEFSGAERDRTADHAVNCRRCSEDLQILLKTHEEASLAKPAGRQARRAALAAAVVLAAAAGILLLRRPPSPMDTVRSGRPTATEALVSPQAGASLPAPPSEFRWTEQPEARGYRVKLFDDAGEPLWQSEETRETRTVLPPAERTRLKAGQAYFWNVEVEGRLERTRLGPFRFRLSPS